MPTSINKLAQLTGFSRESITLRVRRWDLPKDFEPKDVLQLIPLDEHQKQLVSLEEARARQSLADAQLKEAQLKKIESRYADAEEVATFLGQFCGTVAEIIKQSDLDETRKADILQLCESWENHDFSGEKT